MDKIETGKRIKGRRRELKITQEEMAERLGAALGAEVKLPTYKVWEQGRSYPPPEILQKICKILGMSLGYAYTGIEEQTGTVLEGATPENISRKQLTILSMFGYLEKQDPEAYHLSYDHLVEHYVATTRAETSTGNIVQMRPDHPHKA